VDQGWLRVVRPGNIGGHGDNKGFCEHLLLRENALKTGL
jgi:hypothetical protein